MSDVAGDRHAPSIRYPTGDRLTFAEVLAEELDAISGKAAKGQRPSPSESTLYDTIHARNESAPLAALCLSGGGIRSATFSLGVMQGLAKRRLLSQFHYLSTVSGGGYIGSWLTAWIKRKTDDGELQPVARVEQELAGEALAPVDSPADHPIPSGKGVAAEAPAIVQLRRFSNYLAPQIGLLSADLWTLIATVLRNVILNWIVLIPVLLAALALPRLMAAAAWASTTIRAQMLVAAGFAACAWTIGYVSRKRILLVEHRPGQVEVLLLAVVPLWVSAILLTVGWAWWHIAPGLSSSLGDDMREVVLFGALVMFVGWLGYTISIWKDGGVDDNLRPQGLERLGEVVVYVAVGLCGGVILRLAAHAFDDVMLPEDQLAALRYATVAPPTFVLSFTLAATVFVGLGSRLMSEEDREWWSRFGAWALISATAWTAVSVVVLLVPQWIANGLAFTAATLAAGGSGVLTILGGLSKKTIFRPRTDGPPRLKGEAKKEEKSWLPVAVKVGLPIFVVLFAVFLSLLTDLFVAFYRLNPFEFSTAWSEYVEKQLHTRYAHDPVNLVVAVVAVLVGLGASLCVGINKFSLHAMYRNRLIRAYLGASRGAWRKPDPFIGFDRHDDFALCSAKAKPGAARPLFHVVNMALNLVAGGELAWQERKAESMTATSLHVGTRRLGYRRAEEYGGLPAGLPQDAPAPPDSKREGHSLSLGTAMAISGAAASPNMGYHSSPVLTFLMTLFNARLGWWLGNPGAAGDKTYYRESPALALRPLLAEAFGQTDERHPYVYASDGGHFDNLGLYEMVRRRCRYIVVVDAGADPECGYEDVSAAIRKIRSDMGIPIDVPERDKREIYSRSDDEKQNQRGRTALLGTIRYSEVDGKNIGDTASKPSDGYLIYIKPAFYNVKEPLDVVHYATGHQTFPHETTADQFFSESQFESYRTLGLFAVQQMSKAFDVNNWTSIAQFKNSVEEYVAVGSAPSDSASYKPG